MQQNLIIAPGLVDMHVHFREPGYEYKETILTGAMAAAAGGVTACCCMPNTSPIADRTEIIEFITDKAAQAPINVLPIGAVTIGQQGKTLTDFTALKRAGVIALSDDGMPITDDDIMRSALLFAMDHGLLLISHCEEEISMVERDIRLIADTGARIHIAHVSTTEAVDLIRKAKDRGLKITAETCPHYFSLTEEEVEKQGAYACMNPPLRKKKDVDAIITGLYDGTIDVIATDHAPHSLTEKTLPVGQAPNGIIGLETSLAVTLTYLYHTGKFSIRQIIGLMSLNPAEILGIEQGELLSDTSLLPDNVKYAACDSAPADCVIFDPDEEWMVDPSQFKSKARNTPYIGMKLRGKVKRTVCKGKIVYDEL